MAEKTGTQARARRGGSGAGWGWGPCGRPLGWSAARMGSRSCRATAGSHKGQYISLKPKGGKPRQESSKSGTIPESKKQGAFNVQMTRDECQ